MIEYADYLERYREAGSGDTPLTLDEFIELLQEELEVK